jgi:putative ABC transport system permease protein
MIRSYFIIAIRYILRNKIQSVIQIASLAIGITAIILIGLYVDHELSYDKFNEKIDRIYRLEYGEFVGQFSAIGHQIKENIPEVDNVVRMLNWGGTTKSTIRYISDESKEREREIKLVSKYIACDSTVFDVFTFPFIQGDPASALRDPYSAVLTENTAREIFGNKDPVGEGLWIKTPTLYESYFTVTGIIHDIENFHIDIDILLSIVSLGAEDSAITKNILNTYEGGDEFFTYLLLPDHSDVSRTEKNINTFFKDKAEGRYLSEGSTFYLRPLEEIYFSSPLRNEYGYCRHGNVKLLKILSAIAIFILVLACINYINLTTARASLRAREVGVRKVSGSLKSSLIVQFLVESVIISMISLLIAITLVQVLLPTFNQLTMIEINMERFFKPGTILLSIIGILLLGIMAGIYPALYLTAFKPVAFLKGEQLTGLRSVLFRRVLLTFQFAISVVLIIGVFTILRQLKYMKTADLGFDKELIVMIPAYYENMQWDFHKRQVYKEELLKHPNIQKVTFGDVPGFPPGNSDFIEYNGIKIKPNYFKVDPDYFDLMDIELLQGRNFSWDIKGDFADYPNTDEWGGRVIINETLLREIGLESIEDGINVIIEESPYKLEIIGVVEDIHLVSLHHKIEPFIFIWSNPSGITSIKILPNNIQGTIKNIKNEVESMFPKETFIYLFLDDGLDRLYENDERLARIISNFAIVALLIGCLGLFGLSSFMAARRTKEIGIRKAMGASVRIVFLLLSREFVKWISLSVIIACPVAWIIMNRWLRSFAYRTNIGAGIFILAIVIAFAIAFLTVAWQSLKTARTNPVEALRYE